MEPPKAKLVTGIAMGIAALKAGPGGGGGGG